jgi:ABC-type cobalamin/Fe3+-siderophores transport system ATPase subunit
MVAYSYIRIENFKIFGDSITIPLNNPTVLIGPNNAGKTSVIQALALWSGAVRSWVNSRKQKSGTSSIYKRDIIQVPVSETRFFWRDADVRSKNNQPIEMKIAVGVNFEGKVIDIEMVFKYFTPEQISCALVSKNENIASALNAIASTRVDLLYPMSGIDIEEPMLQDGRINVLIGQGQTAQVLRNLCYQVYERNIPSAFNEVKDSESDWQKIKTLIRQLFYIDLLDPDFDAGRGAIILKYTTNKKQKNYPLDIALSGRGQQQMLLILAYMYAHKGSVLLIDEPDAHLEILRQRQVFSLLKEVSSQTGSQIIIATHSEVIIDEAVDVNLNLILNGKSIDLVNKTQMKATLKVYGIEHYYKAEMTKRVIYVEGSTDLSMLNSFAEKLLHPSLPIFGDKLYYYYITDNLPESGYVKDSEKITGSYQKPSNHFYAVKSCVEGFKGLGIFDGDNKNQADDIKDDLALVYWKKYELENYFAFPSVLLRFFRQHYAKIHEGVFSALVEKELEIVKNLIDLEILDFIFDKDKPAFEAYSTLPEVLKTRTFKSNSANKKMSQFLENVFNRVKTVKNEALILTKGNFYELINFIDVNEIEPEIVEKLDLIDKYLKFDSLK